jgi:hypothetical protein
MFFDRLTLRGRYKDEVGVVFRGREGREKHVFLRNEPDLASRKCQRKSLIINWLCFWSAFFESGSFGRVSQFDGGGSSQFSFYVEAGHWTR